MIKALQNGLKDEIKVEVRMIGLRDLHIVMEMT